MSKKLYLVAGHHNSDPGASATHEFPAGKILFKESDLVMEFRNLLFEDLKAREFQAIKDNDDHTLTQVLAWLRAVTKASDLVLDFHFNAATPAATGTEVFVKDNASKADRDLATLLVGGTAEVLKINNRGVKTQAQTARKTIGILNIAPRVILVEICFISNKSDMEKYVKNKHILVRKFTDILIEKGGLI